MSGERRARAGRAGGPRRALWPASEKACKVIEALCMAKLEFCCDLNKEGEEVEFVQQAESAVSRQVANSACLQLAPSKRESC